MLSWFVAFAVLSHVGLASMSQTTPRLSESALRRLSKVKPVFEQHDGVLVVDGNNVRAATGFRYTASEMSTLLDEWASTSSYAGRMLVAWDHGEPTTVANKHTMALFSGEISTADEVIVKLCAHLSGSCDLLVVTSDQGLRGRCHTQMCEAQFTSGLRNLHSVYLTWMMESDGRGGWRSTEALRQRYSKPHGCRSESSEHRAAQARALLHELNRSDHAHELQHVTDELDKHSTARAEASRLALWHLNGNTGIKVIRQSRTGNPIYFVGRDESPR